MRRTVSEGVYVFLYNQIREAETRDDDGEDSATFTEAKRAAQSERKTKRQGR